MLAFNEILAAIVLGGIFTGGAKAFVEHNWIYFFIFTVLFFMLKIIGIKSTD